MIRLKKCKKDMKTYVKKIKVNKKDHKSIIEIDTIYGKK